MAAKAKVLVTRHWPESVEKALARDYDLTLQNVPLSAQDWIEALQSFYPIVKTCPIIDLRSK